MTQINLTVNGSSREVEVEPRRLLAQVLREDLGLTGTHIGCDTSQCGACTVHRRWPGGEELHDARRPGRRLERRDDRGDGGADGTLHPLQEAFCDEHGLQCGFCTPGMIMTAADLLARNPDPSDTEIRHAIEGNICRCTGYHNIVVAIREAAVTMRAGATEPTGSQGLSAPRGGSDGRRHPGHIRQAPRRPAVHHRRGPVPR